MQQGYNYEAVVSIDLGWSPANITRTAPVVLRVGIEMARSSPWVLEARVAGWDGMIPLLADSNLRTLWESNVRKLLEQSKQTNL